MSALQWSALLTATDSDDTDDVVFRGVVVCYHHLSVRFRYYDLPLMTTWQREKKEKEAKGQRLRLIDTILIHSVHFLLLHSVAWKQNISIHLGKLV